MSRRNHRRDRDRVLARELTSLPSNLKTIVSLKSRRPNRVSRFARESGFGERR
jgi:hypothetical protein